MRRKILILIKVLLLIGCRTPINPNGELILINQIGPINTGGDCLDVDINNDIVSVAANYNGYFIYDIHRNDNIIDSLSIRHHETEMQANVGDNRIDDIAISKNHNIVFSMDKLDKIYLHKIEGIPYLQNWLDDCYGDNWLSIAMDENEENIYMYFLMRHYSAEEELVPAHCEDQDGITIDFDQSDCIYFGFTWLEESIIPIIYGENSTSIVWKNFTDIDLEDQYTDSGSPSCEYSTNLNVRASSIYFDKDILAVAYGELGVLIYKQIQQDLCYLGDSENYIETDISNNSICSNYNVDTETSEINFQECCEKLECPSDWLLENGDCSQLYIDDFGIGLGGKFVNKGGVSPQWIDKFDTPGSVNDVYIAENTVFAALSASNGIYFSILDSEGNIVNGPFQFAEGYSINGIDHDKDLIALAAGNDGVLLFEWNNNTKVEFIGKYSTDYTNKVKVDNNTIFIATENGLEIIQIER